MPTYINTTDTTIREQGIDILPGASVVLSRPVNTEGLVLSSDSPCLTITQPQKELFQHLFYEQPILDDKTFAALGYIPGVSVIKKFGYNISVGTSYETIWSAGGLYEYMEEASVVYVASSSANDSIEGTGARKVVIQGLCHDWCLLSEEVELNGQTPVELENTFIRVFRMYVSLSGSSEGADGTIVVSDGSFTAGVPDNKTLAQTINGDNQSLMAVFTVPAHYYGVVYNYYCNTGKSGEVFFDSAVREFGSNTFNVKRRVQTYQNNFHFPNSIPFVFNEKTDIEIRAKAISTPVPASAGFDILLFRKDS